MFINMSYAILHIPSGLYVTVLSDFIFMSEKPVELSTEESCDNMMRQLEYIQYYFTPDFEHSTDYSTRGLAKMECSSAEFEKILVNS